ncbi:NAD(P) transhydrogenase alpha subunit [Thermogutta terrifontis]|uniref:NAD(P) transhydrogenase subunit alpha part 1 n=1 Tax=Thermogutta terrifontis TaxID=1331910 RepID=A0A286RFR2_9BACT|nr:Re/Si-specific NAD(P)(+) transhydrogenase subunit alpha [Thermogutta terrifontis]ASV74804.1 NAD(P) transhydrogenase alpha subunit [Thermogutta terrifontis]
MIIGVLRERFPGEKRVAVVPANVPGLVKAGHTVRVESGAGERAGFPDSEYSARGATITSLAEVLEAEVLLGVRWDIPPEVRDEILAGIRPGQILIGAWDPLSKKGDLLPWVEKGATIFALELLPRITRAQSMDILSSMATLAGYRAVLLAALTLPKIFPMLMTAAGTLTPAKVFVVGAGVAGLQAIATAKRLGAAVSAYDVRPAVKEQVQSLGAKFVELELPTQAAEDQRGYAKELGEEVYRRQRELMTQVVAQSDVVITTASVPGRRAPVLITREMVAGMQPGSVIVDLAAERGGNCELTRPGETVVEHGVTILGPVNLPAEIPHHASQMYSKNITTFFLYVCKNGQIALDSEDEIIRDTLVARGGQVVHAMLREPAGQPSQ